MQTTLLAVAAAFALALPAGADPVHGRWRTAPDDNGNTGQIEMAGCDNRICGTLIRAMSAQGQQLDPPNIGRRIVWDMEPQGNGRYRNGQIWAPDRDRIFSSRMDLQGDRLTVSGCVLIFCRDAVWTRVR